MGHLYSQYSQPSRMSIMIGPLVRFVRVDMVTLLGPIVLPYIVVNTEKVKRRRLVPMTRLSFATIVVEILPGTKILGNNQRFTIVV